ncbi:hypothetical protein KFK09_000041 [Dendrobium nobile]|uniref:Uncharacterized protein n=1 Tax=Dendrobium nobile TaxID=94219 RepID=A0A8T3CC15_DENNO|nr:hypothetical protein KFK09_000041 [Dendrobium nobile]
MEAVIEGNEAWSEIFFFFYVPQLRERTDTERERERGEIPWLRSEKRKREKESLEPDNIPLKKKASFFPEAPKKKKISSVHFVIFSSVISPPGGPVGVRLIMTEMITLLKQEYREKGGGD